MTDTTDEQKTDEKPEDQASGEGAEQTAEEQAATEEAKEEKVVETEETLDLDGAKNALSKVRKEAASYRTKYRDIEAKLAEAKTPEQVEEIVKQIKADNAAEAQMLVVENVALKYKLPDDLAAALKGETREELEAHAKVLAKYAPTSGDDPDLSGGLSPSSGDGAFDPVKEAQQALRNRY